MEDIRRPQRPQRRDYTIPSHSRPHHNPHAPAPPAHPQPPHQAGHSGVVPVAHPPAQSGYQPQPAYRHPSQPAHQAHHPSRQKSKRFGAKLTTVIGIILAAAAIFGAGYLLKSSSGSGQNGIPTNISRQVNYTLYFPSPMPNGYIYMKDSATFQIGQVFYKFAKGNKRVTVQEQPMTNPKPDLSLLAGYTRFDSTVGKAALGSSFGHPTAVIVTPTTVITMNTAGGVGADELKTAIANLKNIGQNTDKKS